MGQEIISRILSSYNTPGPRYTSYPPANFFSKNFTANDYRQSIIASNSEEPSSISIYIHIPFCKHLCSFCGCNTGIAKSPGHIRRYINALLKEIDSVSCLIDKRRLVTQVHWGGGTPNAIPLNLIVEVMTRLRHIFSFHPDAEIAIECSPSLLSSEDIVLLGQTGFNRISLGIQDFNREVLEAVNRKPSLLPEVELFGIIRQNGFRSINLDLMYGLPKQNVQNFAETVRKAIELLPDRLVTFSYAHVPWFNRSMLRLEKTGLPSPEEKIALFVLAYRMLTDTGYIPIGLDHYATPSDELSIALKEKKLHRNFQGYCTRATTGQVYAFGSSGISQLWNSYSQNIKDYQTYTEIIEKNGLATERGHSLSMTEIICREVINSVMCNGYLNFEDMAMKFDISGNELKRLLGFSPEKFSSFINDGLLTIDERSLKVINEGMLIVRNIAMALDPALQVKQGLYSKTI